jgi:uncharacterized OB-fold protein
MLSEVIPGLQRPIPVPTDLTKPFWDAAKEQKLVIQKCSACGKLAYPPRQRCNQCNSAAPLEWTEVEGKGHIDVHLIIRDSRIRGFRSAQPINFAIIRLDEDPGINFLSNLPGTPPGEFEDGMPVQVVYAQVEGSDQLIPEWQIVK